MTRTVGQRAAQVLGVVAYLVLGVFPYLVSGLLVPPAAVVILMAAWAVGLVATIALARRRPLWTPVAPLGALLFWVTFVEVGSRIFGWTA